MLQGTGKLQPFIMGNLRRTVRPSPRKSSSTIPCVMPKAGSVPFGGEWMQRGRAQEKLRDQNKEIEIKRRCTANDISLPPMPGEPA